MRSRYAVQKKPPGLMLTSLLDMFTIILIFLIVSFDAEDQNFKLRPDLKLPESGARSVFKPAVSVAITPNAVFVENEEVVALKDGRTDAANYAAGEIPELVSALSVSFERIQAAIDSGELVSDEEDPAIIVIQADKNLNYDTLYLVLRCSSISGFVRYRLAIMKT